jgi:hypothetical protein
VRHIETTRPGELVHVDVKKQAKVPRGAGWRMNPKGKQGRRQGGKGGRPRPRYAYIHSAVDGHSRLAYSEVLANEQAVTAVGFWRRAQAFFASYGIRVERVMTDNGACYLSRLWTAEPLACANHPYPHEALLPPDQRESRALQPNLVQRVGLCQALSHRGRENSGARQVAAHVQP